MIDGKFGRKKDPLDHRSSGIGRAAAPASAAEGADVWATDVHSKKLDALPCERSIQMHRLDMTNGGANRSLAAELGALDVQFDCGWAL